MINLSQLVWVMVMSISMAACQTFVLEEKKSGTDTFVVDQENRWRSPHIPVCFDTHTGDGQLEQRVKELVTSEFDKTVVRFHGWESCSDPDEVGVHIAIKQNDCTGSKESENQCLAKEYLHRFVKAIGADENIEPMISLSSSEIDRINQLFPD